MRDDYAILNRQLHTFQTEEVKELLRIADVIFEPLLRPFRQKRVVQEFSFKKSIRTAQRIGALMPSYEKVERSHRKSRLVIAMSLAGIDRCSAVSLIPLLSSLKETALDFNFYVYTDDLIKAEFTHDGFLANDYKIAWNHVNGPGIMQRLVELETDSQEDMLLIIDSLGGGASRWYDYWTWEQRDALKEEQNRYLSTAGKYSFYNRIRKQLGGDFSRIKEVKLPPEWFNRVRRNTQERWMETPALEDYMVRWVFHPEFGTVNHGNLYVGSSASAYSVLRRLRGKFRQIHLLTPNNQGSHRATLDRFLKENVVDYHHRANTIFGFANVLANIVHGQCPFDGPFTKKVSYEIIKISEYKGDEEEEVITDEVGDHTENKDAGKNVVTDEAGVVLSAGGKCFDQCPIVKPDNPAVTTVKLERRPRGSSNVEIYELPYNEIDLGELLPADLSQHPFWSSLLPIDFEIDRGDSEYTRIRKAEEVMETIKKYHLVYKAGYGYHGLVRERRPVVTETPLLHELMQGIEYKKHHTSVLREYVENLLLILAPVYHNFMHELALKHIIWCNGSQYSCERRAISINPKLGKVKWKEYVWHEIGHYLEHCCPPVGAFSNELLKLKGGKLDKKKLVQVGSCNGEYAMPVTNGSPDWIMPYAGKWYKRSHRDLPNPTEIVSVHLQYFINQDKLVQLIKHDPDMVRFMAFVLMGGPVIAMSSLRELRRKEALEQIAQRHSKANGGGGYRGRWSSGGGGRKGKVDHGFGF